MKKHLKSIIVLTSICAVIAILMALTNYITAPIIEVQEEETKKATLTEVLPGGEDITEIEDFNTKYQGISSAVTGIYASSNGGYVISLKVNGYGSGMKIMVGIDETGTVVGAKCIDKGGETKGEEETYGERTIGYNIDTIDVVDTVAGSTKTTAAYKKAVKIALQTVEILRNGGELR